MIFVMYKHDLKHATLTHTVPAILFFTILSYPFVDQSYHRAKFIVASCLQANMNS